MKGKKPGSFWDGENKVPFPTEELTHAGLESAKPSNMAAF